MKQIIKNIRPPCVTCSASSGCLIIKRSLKDKQGYALILTLMIISLIMVVTLQFNSAMMFELESAANLKTGTRLRYAAKSGFDYAMAVLYEDALSDASTPPPHDSLFEAWAVPDLLNSQDTYSFENSSFEVMVHDLSGRINVNMVAYHPLHDQQAASKDADPEDAMPHAEGFYVEQQDILRELLKTIEEPKLEFEEVDAIVDSLVDWIDQDDDITGVGGAENSYYQGLETPYPCKNAPLENIEELLLVKGVTPPIYKAISPYLTIYGEGEINVNTATLPVFVALHPDIDTPLAQEAVDYREDENNDISSRNWFINIISPFIDTKDVDIIKNHITAASTCFAIHSRGKMNNRERALFGVVKRNLAGPTIELLLKKAE